MPRKQFADSADIYLTNHPLLDRPNEAQDGRSIIGGNPRRAIEDLTTRKRWLWDVVVVFPGNTPDVGAWRR